MERSMELKELTDRTLKLRNELLADGKVKDNVTTEDILFSSS